MKTLYCLLRCSAISFFKVSSTHCRAIKLGVIADVYVANNVLSVYAKCGKLCVAHNLFDEMSQRDVVSWNIMVAGHVNCGEFGTAWELLRTMRRCGIELDGHTFGSILKGVASAYQPHLGQQVHSMVVKMGFSGNVYSGSALLDMYSKCGRVDDAYVVFHHLPKRNSVSWNALIYSYAQVGNSEMAFLLLECMENEGVNTDDGTISPLLTLLDDSEFYSLTLQIHGKIIKHGLEFYNNVCNATITAYSECGSIEDSERMFDSTHDICDVVTWNSMLAAYLLHEMEELAFRLFIDMKKLGFEPDIYTYTSVISACFEEAHQRFGRSLHGFVIKRGLEDSVPISNALISMYLKSSKRSFEDAIRVFELIKDKDQVSWNSILTGYSQVGFSEDALRLFVKMRFQGVNVDDYSISPVLRSCSDLATLRLGQQVHALAHKLCFETNEHVGSSLVFMYSKCGIIEDARKAFEETPKDSAVTWNAIIFAYGQHGLGNTAIDMFNLMRETRVKLDHITFIALLTACSHTGLVEQGRNFLRLMESHYGITPRVEHYACAIDLYGRAGRLDEAKVLVEAIPFEQDAIILKTLLGACRMCGEIQFASEIASRLLELEPDEHCTYVLLSDLYSRLKRWDEKASVQRLMRERGVKKVPGWSWIEVKNEVHAFNAEDHFHSYCEEIYRVLEGLLEESKKLDNVSNLTILNT